MTTGKGMRLNDPVAGQHDFDGAWAPYSGHTSSHTFSVGCFEWKPKASGKGLRRSAVKVRVSGSVAKPERVYEAAWGICEQLDAGSYHGPKTRVIA